MNETPVKESLGDEASAQARSKREKSLSNRILAYAFLASIVLNIGWVALVSRSTLFGKGTSPLMLHEKPIKVFKPIPVKPRPKPVKPPPPPPKPPKSQPKIKPIVQHIRPRPASPMPATHPAPPHPVTPPTPPKPAIHPVVTHPTLPRPASHPVSVHTTTNQHTTSKLTAPVAPPPGNQSPFVPNSGQDVKAPETKVPDVKTPEVKTPEVKTPEVKAPEPKAPEPKAPEVKTPEVHHPSNWVPIDSQEASLPDGIGDNVSLDGIEPGSTNNDKIVISFTIDETGHIRNARVKESSGNAELDNRYLEAVRRAHGTPAVQDHIPHDQPETKPFSISTG